MKKTTDKIKKVYVNNVLMNLETNGKKHEIELINRQSDLTKQYKRAQSFVRDNKDIFKGIDLYKAIFSTLEKRANGLYENDIVGEKDEEFLNKIDESDKSIIRKEIVVEGDNIPKSKLMNWFFGETQYKIKKDFIDKMDFKKEFIGYKNGNEVFYCEEFNCLYEVV